MRFNWTLDSLVNEILARPSRIRCLSPGLHTRLYSVSRMILTWDALTSNNKCTWLNTRTQAWHVWQGSQAPISYLFWGSSSIIFESPHPTSHQSHLQLIYEANPTVYWDQSATSHVPLPATPRRGICVIFCEIFEVHTFIISKPTGRPTHHWK